MEYRQLGNSGLKVSVLTMGTMTFGGKGNFAKVGNLQLAEVRKLIDIVADAGVNLIDTADIYSAGASEELIGEALAAEAQGRHADRHQGALSDGRGPQRSRPVALASDPRLRSEPEAAGVATSSTSIRSTNAMARRRSRRRWRRSTASCAPARFATLAARIFPAGMS